MCIGKSSLTIDVVIATVCMCVYFLTTLYWFTFFIDDCIKMSTPTSTENENEKQESSDQENNNTNTNAETKKIHQCGNCKAVYKNRKNLSGINLYFLKLVNSILSETYLWRRNPAMLTEERTVGGWWEDPSCHSPGSGESKDVSQRPDDWILWGCLVVREAWSKFPVWRPAQSTDWSPSQGGSLWTLSTLSGRPRGSAGGCSLRSSTQVPDKIQTLTEKPDDNRICW